VSFPPTVGTKYQTIEGRVWTVDSVDEDGMHRAVLLSTDDRTLGNQEVLEEEWTDFEASARVTT
jgi:hypothetical protein